MLSNEDEQREQKVPARIGKSDEAVSISRRLRGLVDQAVFQAKAHDDKIERRPVEKMVEGAEAPSGTKSLSAQRTMNKMRQVNRQGQNARLVRQAMQNAASNRGGVVAPGPSQGSVAQPLNFRDMQRSGHGGPVKIPATATPAPRLGQQIRNGMPNNVANIASRALGGRSLGSVPTNLAGSKDGMLDIINRGGRTINPASIMAPKIGTAGSSRFEKGAPGQVRPPSSLSSLPGNNHMSSIPPAAAAAMAGGGGAASAGGPGSAPGGMDPSMLLAAASEDTQSKQSLGDGATGKANSKDGDVFNRHKSAQEQNEQRNAQNASGQSPDEDEGPQGGSVSGKVKITAVATAAGFAIVAMLGGAIGIGGGAGGSAVGGGAAYAAAAANSNTCSVDGSVGTGTSIDADAGAADLQNQQVQTMIPVFDKESRRSNAYAIITAVWAHKGIAEEFKPRAAVIAIATATQESTLVNVGYGDAAGPDSRGLFQQRDSWGSLEDRLNPGKSAALFLNRLVKVPNWNSIPVTQAAQKVQISAFPDAYAKWEEWGKYVLQQYKKDGGQVGGGGSNDVTTASGENMSDGSEFERAADIQLAAEDNTDGNGKPLYVPGAKDAFWNQPQNSLDSRAVYIASRTNWPSIKSYGGYAKRSGKSATGDHPKGHAVDIMIPDYKSTQGISTGNAVAAYFQANAKKYGITYLIWRNKSWAVGQADWKPYNGGGFYSGSQINDTTLHMDHVHVSVKGSAGEYDAKAIFPEGTNTLENGSSTDQVTCGEGAGDAQLAGIDGSGGVSSIIKGDWASPFPNKATTVRSKFGYRGCFAGISCNQWATTHYGLDLADGVGRGTAVGSPVYAPTKMKVTAVRDAGGDNYNGGYGISIMAQSLVAPGYVFDMHHFAPGTLAVKVGDVLEAGQFVARAGTTGNSTGTHLHFQVQKPGANAQKMVHSEAVDPAPILKKAGIYPGQK